MASIVGKMKRRDVDEHIRDAEDHSPVVPVEKVGRAGSAYAGSPSDGYILAQAKDLFDKIEYREEDDAIWLESWVHLVTQLSRKGYSLVGGSTDVSACQSRENP